MRHPVFQRHRVVAEGAIDRSGTFGLLLSSVPYPDAPDCGNRYFHEKLLSFRDGAHRIRLSTNTALVTDVDSAEVVLELQTEELWYVHMMLTCQVLEGGLLLPVLRESDGGWTEAALKEAELGQKPRFCDNSPFLRVDPELKGKLLTKLRLDVHGNKYTVVDEETGIVVPHHVEYPLAFKRWGVPCTPASLLPNRSFRRF